MFADVERTVEGMKRVIDPELGINMVALGLLYGVTLKDVDGNEVVGMFLDEYEEEVVGGFGELAGVKITMTLTTPGCPLGGFFLEQVAKEVSLALGIEPEAVEVNIVFDPPWTPGMIQEESRAELGLD